MPRSSVWLLSLATAAVALAATGCGGTRASAQRILFVSDRAGAWALYSMNANGGDQHRVGGDVGHIEPGGEGVGIGVPTLTPDGREVLLPRRGITAVTLATGARRRISSGEEQSVVWSPDGRQFLCSGPGLGSAPIYVIDLQGGRKRLLPGTRNGAPAGWSPDGRWILFARQHRAGPYYLWRIHPDGKGLRRISGYTPNNDVLWLPDGRAEFIGTKGDQSTGRLVVLDPRNGEVKILGTLLTPDYAEWSPDGRTIVYAAGKNQSTPTAVYTMNVNGGDRKRLTPRGADYYDASPEWSPDGKNVIFERSTDSGIQRYTPEIWTMRVDGSHQRQLTQPYPDGGENVDPIWIQGPVTATASARPAESRRGNRFLLRVPYLVNGIGAQGKRAAVAPLGSDMSRDLQPTPPLLVWRPGNRPEPLVGALCGSISASFFVGQRLAIACNHDFLDEHQQAVLVYDLRTRIPAEPMWVYNAYFGTGTQSGTVVNGPVLAGDRIEFESSPWTGQSKKFKRSKLLRQTLWSVEGAHRRMVRSAHRLGSLIAGDRDWLVFQLENGDFAVATPSGERRRVLSLPPLHVSFRDPPVGFLVAGNELIRLGGGRLEAWDVRNGRMLLDRSVPAKAQLQAADGRLVVYTVGSDLHLLSRAGDHIVHTPAAASRPLSYYGATPLRAALSTSGLFYAYDVKGSRFPGRVVFVPRSALPR